jgi:hypothetical protein
MLGVRVGVGVGVGVGIGVGLGLGLGLGLRLRLRLGVGLRGRGRGRGRVECDARHLQVGGDDRLGLPLVDEGLESRVGHLDARLGRVDGAELRGDAGCRGDGSASRAQIGGGAREAAAHREVFSRHAHAAHEVEGRRLANVGHADKACVPSVTGCCATSMGRAVGLLVGPQAVARLSYGVRSGGGPGLWPNSG